MSENDFPANSGNITPVQATASPSELTTWEALFREIDGKLEKPIPGSTGYAEFALDFENALAHQLAPFFEALPTANLIPSEVEQIPLAARGAYYLYLHDKLVYIGKSDAKAGLRVRLLRHYRTLRCRKGITSGEMRFKAVKVHSFSALDTESLLIEIFTKQGQLAAVAAQPPSPSQRRPKVKAEGPQWNNSGFGSNDTGKERDTQKVSRFDAAHPIDVDTVIEFQDEAALANGKTKDLRRYIEWLANELPFTFRIDKDHLAELEAISINSVDLVLDKTLRGLFLAVHALIPAHWSLTLLRGKAILYKGDNTKYKSPLWVLRSAEPALEPCYDLPTTGDKTTTPEA